MNDNNSNNNNLKENNHQKREKRCKQMRIRGLQIWSSETNLAYVVEKGFMCLIAGFDFMMVTVSY